VVTIDERRLLELALEELNEERARLPSG